MYKLCHQSAVLYILTTEVREVLLSGSKELLKTISRPSVQNDLLGLQELEARYSMDSKQALVTMLHASHTIVI